MKVLYKEILKKLKSKYQIVQGQEKSYLLNEQKQIIGTITDKLIVLFYKCEETIIWNHQNKVALAIAKDFVYGNGEDIKKADVMYIEGLCGATNDINVTNDFYLETEFNLELPSIASKEQEDPNLEELGTIGYVENLEDNYRFISEDFIIQFKGKKYTTNTQEMNLLILKDKGKAKINYEDLYKMLREKNDWYYQIGCQTAGSKEVRDFVESRHYKSYESTYHPKINRI